MLLRSAQPGYRGMLIFDLLACFRRWVIFSIAATVLAAPGAEAQDAEPRQYSNTPVGLNFLIAGYIYAQGQTAFDPGLRIADAQFHSNTGALAYVRSFDFLGQSAKFDVFMTL